VSPLPALLPATVPQSEEVLLGELVERAQKFARGARAENTLRAYRSDWRDFEGWCCERTFVACPASPQTVALYLTALSRIRRSLGTAAEAKRPLLVPDLQAMVNAIPDNLIGLRDRALLLIGFSGAFRRSELVALDCEDLTETADGLVVTIRRSKTDQEAEGRKVAIPRGREESTCPLRALFLWRAAAEIESGPVFLRVNRHGQILRKRLSAEAVAIVVKRWAGKLGYHASDFAGHSLRSGLATAAAIAGKSERAIMNQTGHRSTATVRRYIRVGNLFRDNAAEGLGL
jgi:integrase